MTTCNHCGATTDGLSEEERAALARLNESTASAGEKALTAEEWTKKSYKVRFYQNVRAPLEAKVREQAKRIAELEAQLAARGEGLPAVGTDVEVVDNRDGSRWMRATVKIHITHGKSPSFEVNERLGLFQMSDLEFTWRRIPAQASTATAHHGLDAMAQNVNAQASQGPAKRKCSHGNGTMQGNQGTTLCVACGDRVVPPTAAPDEVTMEHSKKFWSEGGGLERDNWAAIEADIRANVSRERKRTENRIGDLEWWSNKLLKDREEARAEVARLTEELERAKAVTVGQALEVLKANGWEAGVKITQLYPRTAKP